MTATGSTGSRGKQPGVLSYRPFRRLWFALSLSSLGDWLSILALTAMAKAITSDQSDAVQGYAVGGVLILKLLPAVVFGPVAGAVADRFDRRRTMVIADLIRFSLFVSIPLAGSLPWLLVATLLVEAVTLFWIPAKEASIPNLVPKERLEAANQLNLLATYGSAPVAGVLFATLSKISDALASAVRFFQTNPVDLALYINGVTFLISALTIVTLGEISANQRLHISAPSVLRQILEGWRFVGRTALVRGLVIGMLGAFAAGGAVIGVGLLYVDALNAGEAAYGILFGAVFLGMALGMFLGPRMLRDFSRRRLFGLSITGAGLTLALIALIPNLVLIVMFTTVLGACAGIAWVTGYTLVGLEVDDTVRGRTFAFLQSIVRVVLLLVIALVPFVAAQFGTHTFRLPIDTVYRFDGTNAVLLIAAVIGIAVGFVSYRHMDDRPSVPLLPDLLAALRGEVYRPETTEPSRGLFVAFEGGEGSGKTTHARLLAIWLRDQGFDVLMTHEPGATKVGMRLRAILLDMTHKGLSPRAEALLYAADRAEHVDTVIRPALQRGAVVISDRYVDSSIAYQGAGRALDVRDIAKINAWATGGLTPHLTVLLDVPANVGLSRFAHPADRMESEPLNFHERVRRGFRVLAEAEPGRYLVIDGTQPVEEIARQVQHRVQLMLPDPVPVGAEDITRTMPAIRD